MDEYLPILVTYNLTDLELTQLNQGINVSNFSAPPILERLQGFELSQFGINLRCNEFNTTYQYSIPCECHTDEDHEAAPCGHPTGEVTFTISEIGACSDDGGSTSSGNGSGTASGSVGGGGGVIDWGGAEFSPYDPSNYDTQDILAEGPMTQINMPLYSIVRANMGDLLDFHDTTFLNNFPHIETAFNAYLFDNDNTNGYQFVDWSIDYLQYLFTSGQPQITGLETLHPENLAFFNEIVNTNQSSEEIISDLQFHQLAEEALADGGEVDFENKVILDSSFVNDPRLKCAYDKLTADNNPLFRNTVGSFINNPKFNLTFKKGNCANTDEQCTNTTDPYNITITFESVYSPIVNANAILHEAIHAELARYVALHQDGIDTNDYPRLFELYDFYRRQNVSEDNLDHPYMALYFINPMADALSQFDNNSYPRNYYKSFVWDGLRKWDVNNVLGNGVGDTYAQYRPIVINNTTVCND